MDGCMNGYMDGWFVLNAVYDTLHPHSLRELGMSYSNIRKNEGPLHTSINLSFLELAGFPQSLSTFLQHFVWGVQETTEHQSLFSWN